MALITYDEYINGFNNELHFLDPINITDGGFRDFEHRDKEVSVAYSGQFNPSEYNVKRGQVFENLGNSYIPAKVFYYDKEPEEVLVYLEINEEVHALGTSINHKFNPYYLPVDYFKIEKRIINQFDREEQLYLGYCLLIDYHRLNNDFKLIGDAPLIMSPEDLHS